MLKKISKNYMSSAPQKIKPLIVRGPKRMFRAIFQILLSEIFGSKFLSNILKANLKSY